MAGSPIEQSSLEVDEPLDPAKASPKLLENRINECSTFSHGQPNFEELRLFESPDSAALLIKTENLIVHQETYLPLQPQAFYEKLRSIQVRHEDKPPKS